MSLLAEVLDVLSLIRSEMWALRGQKPPPFRPSPRPRTAADRVEAARRQRDRQDLTSRLFPEGR